MPNLIPLRAAKQPSPARLTETDATFLREQFRAALARRDTVTAARLRRQLCDSGWLIGRGPAFILRPRPGRTGGL